MNEPSVLLMDIGNTHTVVGLATGKKIEATWRISTHPLLTADELHLKLTLLVEQKRRQLSDFGAIVVASVVPAFTRVCLQAWGTATGRHPPLRIIDSSSPFSFTNLTENPAQVGTDRLVNAEAAWVHYGAPAIIVDSGTATTLCALQKTSTGVEYLGGAIVPGLELAMRALAERTAQLRAIELVAPHQAIGRNTTQALQSGLVLGYGALIDGLIERFFRELGSPPSLQVLATGGVSPLMKGIAHRITHFDDQLTLKGMLLIHERISG